MRRDRRIECKAGAERTRQRLDLRVVARIMAHKDRGEIDPQALAEQKARGGKRPRQRAPDLGNRVMNFRAMRVDADLDAFETELAQRRRFGFLDQNAVALELDAEVELTGAPDDREKISAQQRLAPAERQA